MITKTINESELYDSLKETEIKTTQFGKNIISTQKNIKSSEIGVFSPTRKSGITTKNDEIQLVKLSDNSYLKNDIKDVKEIKHSVLDKEIYQAAKDFAYVSGYDFRSDHYLRLVRSKNWIDVKTSNIKTMILYHHFKHENAQSTISLPLFAPSFSKRLYIDIDNNQEDNIAVNTVVKQLEKDFSTSFYKEGKYGTGTRGVHLVYEFNTEFFENARIFLEKYYKEKYNFKIEANLKTMRVVYSKAYHKGAVDSNNNRIESAAHLVEVFRKGQSLSIPEFLLKHNKHGKAISRTRNYNKSNSKKDISLDNISISRGNRVKGKGMFSLAFYSISKNLTRDEYAQLCYSINDSKNPSKDLLGPNSEKIIDKIYNWALDHYNDNSSDNENSITIGNHKKPTEFLNECETELNDKDYNMFQQILTFLDPYKETKYSNVKKRFNLNTLIMYEAVLSMFEYEKLNPSDDYSLKKLAKLNNGIAIAIGTVELIALKYKITNWKKVWKVVKSILLESIKLENGYEYSYVNDRFAIHYISLKLNTILNNLLKKYKNKYLPLVLKYYYNLCKQYFNNIDSLNELEFTIYYSLQRAGP